MANTQNKKLPFRPAVPATPVQNVRFEEPEGGTEKHYVNGWEVVIGGSDVNIRLGQMPTPAARPRPGGTVAEVKVHLILSHHAFEVLTQTFAENLLLIQEMYQEVYGLSSVPSISSLTAQQIENVNTRLREKAEGGKNVELVVVSPEGEISS